MQILLNLLAGVALLVWGTHIVRTGILRIYGSNLRRFLRVSVAKPVNAFFAGVGITALIQSSTATALIVAAFAGQGLIGTAQALAVMLGADVGTSLVTVVLSFDLSWLSPLLIFIGVVLFLARQENVIGQFGRVLIGLGLIMFALQWISVAAKPMVQAAGVQVLFASLTGDVLLDMLVAALMTILCYSSLAVVLLMAALASLHVIALPVALGLVLGANLGSGLLGMLSTLEFSARGAPGHARQLPVQADRLHPRSCRSSRHVEKPISALGLGPAQEVVLFHLALQRDACPRSSSSSRRRSRGSPSGLLPTQARRRRPRQAPASRSVRARHADARHFVRGARGAAHRRRHRADAAGPADRCSRPTTACSPSGCARWTTSSTTSTPRSSST